MQVGKVDYMYVATVTNRDDVMIPSLHGGGQVVEIVLDVVSMSVCNHARVNLNVVSR